MSDAKSPDVETVTTDDGWVLSLNHFRPESLAKGMPVLLFLPALGAPARAYRRMAAHFRDLGYACVTADLRGSGASGPLPRRGVDYGIADHLDRDVPAILDHLGARHPGRPVVAIGHSLGGHIATFTEAMGAGRLAGIVLLTVARVHIRYFPRSGPVIFNLFRALGAIGGYVPGQRVGFGAPIARTLGREWALWGLRGRYRDAAGRDLEGPIAGLGVPVLSVAFTDDLKLGHEGATSGFNELIPPQHLTAWRIAPEEVGMERLGHLEHLRGAAPVWDRIADWIEAQEFG